MKRLLAIAALVVSVPILALALLFLIAAMTRPDRLLVTAGLLAVGALPLAWGIATLRRQAEISPDALASGTVALARRLGGEVTEAQVQAEFRIPRALALDTLEKLCLDGQARREVRADRVVYVVRGLQASFVTRRCPYCGSSFPVREAVRKCPNCGAAVELDKT
ncbi:MAG: zinc ribbon domain-containing protein [Anaerolineae bacterium]|nr:zinc ribbon domain-containing protein [Anaerolineae bacterium]